LGVDFRLVIPMTTRTDDAGALADEALVCIGLFYQLDVPRTVAHDWDSSMIRWTSRICDEAG